MTKAGKLIRRKPSPRIPSLAILARAPAAERRNIEAAFRLPLIALYYPEFSRHPKALQSRTPPTRKPVVDDWLAYNYARWRVIRMVPVLETRPIVAADLRELCRWQGMAMRFRDAIFEQNLGLVFAIVKRGADGEHEDAQAVGGLSLVAAIERFDVRRGWQFSSYACRAIAREAWRQRERWRRQRETADSLQHDAGGDCEEAARVDASDAVTRAMATLSRRERMVIFARYGLGRADAQKLTEIAGLLGVSKERVRQIEEAALEKMRQALEAEPANDSDAADEPSGDHGELGGFGFVGPAAVA